MTYEECIEVLDRYKGWNAGQKSSSFASGGPKTSEDEIYDARRKLILAATNRLAEIAGA